MKKSNKKIPKTHLPKYEYGSIHEADHGANGTSNIYNQGRQSKISANQYAQAGAAITAGGMQAFNANSQEDTTSLEKTRGIQSGADTAKVGVATAINPVLGMGVGALTGIGNKVQTNVDQTDANGNLVNRNKSKMGEIAGGFLSPSNSLIGIFSDPNATTGQKVAGALTGGLSDMFTNRHRNQVESSAKENQFAGGGMNITPNAEVEKQENTLNPDGSTDQYDGESHENGGIPVNLDPGTLIFSDKLKLGGKTFAKLNKPNMTYKEDKILEDNKSSTMSKLTANLMKQAKNKSSMELFEAQEALKQSKLDSYTKRLGGIMKYPNGGKVNNNRIQSPFYSPSNNIVYNNQGANVNSDSGFFPENYNKTIYHPQLTGDQVIQYANHPNTYSMNHLDELNRVDRERILKMQNYLNKNNSTNTQKYPNGGITPTQYKQAQSDSLTLYNAGLQSNKRPYYDYPGTTEAMQRLQDVNSTNNRIVAPEAIQGEAYGNQPGYNGGYNVKFQKPTMLPYKQIQTPLDNNGVQKVENYAQPIGKPVQHPNYNQFISGVNQSKQPVQIEQFRKGGRKDPNDINALNSRQQSDYNAWYNANNQNEGFNPDDYSVDNYMKQYESRGATSPTISSPDTGNAGQGNKFDWKGLGTQAAYFAANNAGNIYDLARSRKVENTKFQRATASLLDDSAAMRDANEQTRRAEYNVRGASGGNAGTYLSNRVGLNTENIMNKDRIRQQYANANAGISNQVNQVNTGIANQEYVANEQNRAASRSTKQGALAYMGSNTANQMNDVRNTNMDQKKLDGLIKMYPALAKDPKMLEYFMSFHK